VIVVGLSHKTAPIEVRERLAFSSEQAAALLADLVQQPTVTEALVVSTCNRVEIVAAGRRSESLEESAIAASVRDVLSARAPGVNPHLYAHMGEHAVRHLFRVASSLDSLVMGEPQILGQVKSACEAARKQGTIGVQLNRAVSHALRAAKRVRTETALGAGQVSVPSVAVDLARQIFGDLRGHRALLIGSGQMGEAAAKLLVTAGAKLGVMGRNKDRVLELAAAMQGEPHGFEDLADELSKVDVIVTTTSSPVHVVTREQVAQVKKKRRGKSLFLIDLAVPRDVDPGVGDLDGVFLYNVDDLSQIVAETLSTRKREAEAAEQIVEGEARSYERALSAAQATPTILGLRQQFGAILEAELERSLRGRLKHLGEDEREALQRMTESALNKLLHPATRHLRQLATAEDAEVELDNAAMVLRDVFALPDESAPNAALAHAPGSHVSGSLAAGTDAYGANLSLRPSLPVPAEPTIEPGAIGDKLG
jgi:glutamyl-tRNA reductase